jgi:hypothetical protein
VALGLLSLIEALDPRTITDGKVGRFDKRPEELKEELKGSGFFLCAAVFGIWIPDSNGGRFHTGHPDPFSPRPLDQEQE